MSIRRAALAVVIAVVSAPPAMALQPPGPPWPEVISPDGITLRWYPDETSEAAAQQVADAHCAQAGRQATLAELEQNGSEQVGTYRCE
jgi:hypothetical protein